jgi:FlaA1/EpsC-like NDP-sugar epimerase
MTTWRMGAFMVFQNKRVLVTGGTGSLGKVLVKRLIKGINGFPQKVIVFSRDEAKQHFMRLEYLNKKMATDEVIYSNFQRIVEFRIGDVRDYASIASALKDCDVVINAAALKQVPSCEYFVEEAVKTNILGPCNIVRAIDELRLPIETVVGVSTDKACKPINAMGMTKALQERVFLSANLKCQKTRFVCVRYGNVLSSRGSVIPLFHDQIANGGPVTITSDEMTRFLLTLEHAVDIIVMAIKHGERGQLFIPMIPAAKVVDIAKILIGDKKIEIKNIGLRPGEKLHEILISEEEKIRTTRETDHFVISSALPELKNTGRGIEKEYSSADSLIGSVALYKLLETNGLLTLETETKELLK